MGAVVAGGLADADAAASMPVVGLAVEPLSVGQLGRILLRGVVNNNGWAWTPGGKVYASTVAGALTQTKPTGVDDVAQEIGVAITATELDFDPKLGGDSLSLLDYEVQTGIIAEPTITSRGNGHTVIVFNSTEDRGFIWSRVNGDSDWMGVEVL